MQKMHERIQLFSIKPDIEAIWNDPIHFTSFTKKLRILNDLL